MRRIRLASLAILCAVPALAQTNATYVLTSTNTVTPNTPMTTVSIWATWDDPGGLFLFASGNYDLTAGDGQFSNPDNVLQGPFSSAGIAAGNVISGGVNGQPFWAFTSRDNPILLAEYDWTTTVFTPRTVNLFTSNTEHFIVYQSQTGNRVSLFPQEFTPGLGVINVVPAPAAWPALVLPIVAGRRRRRW